MQLYDIFVARATTILKMDLETTFGLLGDLYGTTLLGKLVGPVASCFSQRN